MHPIIENQPPHFDIPDDVTYLNCAALAPMMRAAQAAAAPAIQQRGRPWEMAGKDWFEGAEARRSLFARVLGADPDGIALVPAASYGLAVAAHNLTATPGQFVLVVGEDFPSNVYTWKRFCRRTGAALRTVAREAGQSWTDAVRAGLDDAVAVVAVPNVHWTDGALLDLHVIGREARIRGARLVVDASQSVGAMPFDVEAIRPDYLVAVGYKWLLGPFGLGYLYVDPRNREGVPLEENWIVRSGAEDFSRLVDYQERYQPGARRFDVGQRTAFELTPVAVVALEQLLAWGVDRIGTTLRAKTKQIEAAMAKLGLRTTSRGERAPHILGIALPEHVRDSVAGALRADRVHVAMRGNAMRISPHLYTGDGDIDRLAASLKKCL